MMGNFTENIKRMMGWCPQKDFDFTHLDNMNKTNMNAIYSQNKVPEYDRGRVKILVDSSRDAGIISILMPATIIFYFFYIYDHQEQILCYRYNPNFDILFCPYNITSSE